MKRAGIWKLPTFQGEREISPRCSLFPLCLSKAYKHLGIKTLETGWKIIVAVNIIAESLSLLETLIASIDAANMLIEFAEDFYRRAKEEFSSAVSEGDAVDIRDSAEKAWNAVIQTINAMLLSRPGKIPKPL